MLEYIEIGASPFNEECVQVGADNYAELAQEECRRFIAELRKQYGAEPNGAKLRVKGFPHDFGSYYEVICNYDTNIDDACDYAMNCERGVPYWTDAVGGTKDEGIREEIFARIDSGDYDISDIFDGDLVDIL